MKKIIAAIFVLYTGMASAETVSIKCSIGNGVETLLPTTEFKIIREAAGSGIKIYEDSHSEISINLFDDQLSLMVQNKDRSAIRRTFANIDYSFGDQDEKSLRLQIEGNEYFYNINCWN